MPTYTYRLSDGSTQDVHQPITAEPYEKLMCPHCNGTGYVPANGRKCPHCINGWQEAKRVYSAPGIVLKGGGFFRNGG